MGSEGYDTFFTVFYNFLMHLHQAVVIRKRGEETIEEEAQREKVYKGDRIFVDLSAKRIILTFPVNEARDVIGKLIRFSLEQKEKCMRGKGDKQSCGTLKRVIPQDIIKGIDYMENALILSLRTLRRKGERYIYYVDKEKADLADNELYQLVSAPLLMFDTPLQEYPSVVLMKNWEVYRVKLNYYLTVVRTVEKEVKKMEEQREKIEIV